MVTTLMPADKNSFILQTISSYGKGLLNFIRRRVKTEEDAEDILQDVWFQFSNVLNAEPIEQAGAWLYRVARNRISDKHKKKTEVLFEESSNDDDDEDAPFVKQLLLTDSSTPETEYLKNLFWEQLFIALGELPEEQRQVFIWHELEDLSFREIMKLSGENNNTLVLRKRYAVIHLRKRLKQLHQEITQY